jgi:hypothetical protein
MCRGEVNISKFGWLIRGVTLAVCLQFAAFAHASSCGHYVFTKIEWMAVSVGGSFAADANLSSAERLVLELDRRVPNPRFSTKHRSPNMPCHGPGCRQLPDTGTLSPVALDPVRVNGVDFVATSNEFEIPRSGGFDPVMDLQLRIVNFTDYLFRPPRA